MLKTAEYITRNSVFYFTQSNMKYFRRRIAWEIKVRLLLDSTSAEVPTFSFEEDLDMTDPVEATQENDIEQLAQEIHDEELAKELQYNEWLRPEEQYLPVSCRWSFRQDGAPRVRQCLTGLRSLGPSIDPACLHRGENSKNFGVVWS